MSTADKPLKACIFDLDGTLLDTLGDLASAVNRALAAYGFPARTVPEVKSFIGDGARMLISRAAGIPPEDPLCAGIRARFALEYKAHLFDETAPFPGAPALIKTLHDKGVFTAVVSNKDDSCAVRLIRDFFGDTVDEVRGCRADSERKPNPATTLSVLGSAGIEPQNAVFIGDGRADVLTAAACGMPVVPVAYGYTDCAILREFSGTEPAKTVEELSERLLSRL